MKRTVFKLSLMEIWNRIQTLKVGRNFFCIVGRENCRNFLTGSFNCLILANCSIIYIHIYNFTTCWSVHKGLKVNKVSVRRISKKKKNSPSFLFSLSSFKFYLFSYFCIEAKETRFQRCAMSVYISNFLLLLSPNSPFPPPILRNSKRNDRSLVRLNEQKCFDWSENTLVMHSFTRDFRAGIDAPWKMQHNGGRGGTRAYKNRQMDRGFVLFPRHFKRRNTSSSIVARIGIFPRFFFLPDKSSNHRS